MVFDQRQKGLLAKRIVRTKEAPQRQRMQLELRSKKNLQAGPLVITAKGPDGTIGFAAGRGRIAVAEAQGVPGAAVEQEEEVGEGEAPLAEVAEGQFDDA